MGRPMRTQLRIKRVFLTLPTAAKRPSFMTTILQLHPILQNLFTDRANTIARQTGFIRRQRKLTGAQFLQGVVFGWLHHPQATRQQLHQSLRLTGSDVCASGFEQRFTPQAVLFLQAMVQEAMAEVFEAEGIVSILDRFQGLYLTDSTRLEGPSVPMKIAARLELQRGALQLSLEDLKTHDNVTQVCEQSLPRGALHIGDLGFFDLSRFAQWSQAGVAWLSRYKVGTTLYRSSGEPLNVLAVLAGRSKPLSLSVLVGRRQQVCAQLVAQRVSESLYQQRLQRLRQRASRKQHPLSARQVLLAGWIIYLTSVSDLSFAQVHTLYRARWQIECLFKRWKSLAHLAHSPTTDPCRQACERLAKLLAVLVAHWVSQASAWTKPHLSRYHVFQTIQHMTPLLYLALFRITALLPLLEPILQHLYAATVCSRRKKHPNAVQLWECFDASA
jgi:hypothetical protein